MPVRSKYLASLSEEERMKLRERLYKRQEGKCFICYKPIDLELQPVNIDHIIPLSLGGKDDESNLALTHETCNQRKQDANLEVARVIYKFEEIREKVYKSDGFAPDISHILKEFGGSKYELSIKVENGKVKYSFPELGDSTIHETVLYNDELSGFKSFFIELPIEYIFHDEKGINPRKLTNNVIKLIKEFYSKRPQLHIGLARINLDSSGKAKVFIFDGQHKAAAQILLGCRKILLRVFLNPDLDVLATTNERAGTVLRQLAFDKSVQRQLGSTILSWRIEKFQQDKKLEPDDYSFSEKDLVLHFKGEGREIKKYILDWVRRRIIDDKNNKLVDYINFGGREKEKPLSYSSIEKTFFSIFLYNDVLDVRPFFSKERENEVENMVKLMNIVVDEVLKDNYSFKVGVYKIEERVRREREGRSSEHIPDSHLMACRIVKEEIMHNWLSFIKQIIQTYFTMKGIVIDGKRVLQEDFDEHLWNNITNFIKNLKELPLWVDRERTHIFSAKQSYGYWHNVFRTGKTPDGIELLPSGINIIEMIKR